MLNRTEGSPEQRLSAIGEFIEPDADHILEQCEAHQATAGRNYLPFLTRFYSHQRRRYEQAYFLVQLRPLDGILRVIVIVAQQRVGDDAIPASEIFARGAPLRLPIHTELPATDAAVEHVEIGRRVRQDEQVGDCIAGNVIGRL